jgi:hypothetical protein
MARARSRPACRPQVRRIGRSDGHPTPVTPGCPVTASEQPGCPRLVTRKLQKSYIGVTRLPKNGGQIYACQVMFASSIRASPASVRPGRATRHVAYRSAEPLPRFSCSLGTAPSSVPAESTHRPGWHRASGVELAGCSRSTISKRSRAGLFQREWVPDRPTAPKRLRYEPLTRRRRRHRIRTRIRWQSCTPAHPSCRFVPPPAASRTQPPLRVHFAAVDPRAWERRPRVGVPDCQTRPRGSAVDRRWQSSHPRRV